MCGTLAPLSNAQDLLPHEIWDVAWANFGTLHSLQGAHSGSCYDTMQASGDKACKECYLVSA